MIANLRLLFTRLDLSVLLHKCVSSGSARFLTTKPSAQQHTNMKIELLPTLKDNYMYLLIDEVSNQAACIDPYEPEKVLAAEALHKVNLVAALVTHHHWDHAGGNEKLASLRPDIKFYGGDYTIPAITLNKIEHNDQIKIGTLTVRCVSTPCHTKEHMCYYVTNEGEDPAVFTGDTLFSAGCGRFFEGSAQQMHDALITKLSALSDNTRVYCGHEYTVANLMFARQVEPDNVDIQSHLRLCLEKRRKGSATIPSTIGLEKRINPFMRVAEASVQSNCSASDPVHAMESLRNAKNKFTPPDIIT